MKTEDVLSDFQMIGSRIAKLSVKNDLVSLTDEEPFKKQLELSHSIGELSVEDQETLVCPLQLHVKVKIKNGKDACNFDIIVEGCFSSKKSDEEKFRKMLEINGIAALYGVARGIVSSVSSLTFAQGNIVLPMINVVQYSRLIKTETTKQKPNEDTK
ncbi:MAG: hypothetical protein VB034_02435 [Eubacteriales bacterium]|nr:hypothetical protein [Eubacteriales bacterium]